MTQNMHQNTKPDVYISMNERTKRAFVALTCDPRDHLCTDIVRVIALRETRNNQIRFWGYSAVAVISLVGIIPITITLVRQLGNTGFYQYVSLAFSDTGSITPYWKQFTVTLAESLPATNVAILLGVILILGWSSRNALRQNFKRSLSTIRIARS